MYEEALELLRSRDAAIQFDKQIFNILASSGISISEIWNQLVHLKNGSIRFNACQDFLEHQLGPGRLEQAGDVRIVYFSDGVRITLPGLQAPEQCIFVSISSVYRIVEKPSLPLPINKREKFLEEYVCMLQKSGGIPNRVRLRLSSENKDWSDLMCWIYYIFVLHPRDWMHGYCAKDYWIHELEEEKSLRISNELSAKNCWASQRIAVDAFKKRLYQNLLPFSMPIMLQIPRQKAMPIEKLFTLSGC